jgi:outer membrane protein
MRFKNGFAGLLVYLSVSNVQAQVFRTDSALSTVTETLIEVSDVILSDIRNVRIGLGPVIFPDYDGSDSYKVSLKPLFTLRYRDVFQIDNNRLRVFVVGSNALFPSERFKLGPLLKIGSGRDEDNNTALTGLGNVGTSVEFGIFGSYEIGPAQLRLRIQKDVANGHSGLVVIGDVQSGIYKTENLTVVVSLSSSWSDGRYMDSFFGINGMQSLASGLPVFNAGSGLKDVKGGFGANYNLSDHWSVMGFAGYSRLLGDANNSPLVKLRGSPNQFASGVFASFRF